MKLEKECKIGRVYSTVFLDGSYHLLFECIIIDKITKEENDIFKKITDKLKIKLTLEVEESILDDVEKEYLSGVIRPFRDRIKFIRKNCIYGQEYINVVYNSKFKDDTNFCLPLFEPNTMYKNMELNKEYTLEGLGL